VRRDFVRLGVAVRADGSPDVDGEPGVIESGLGHRMHDQVTFVTSCGRRVAAVISVAAAEQAAAADGPGDEDASTAVMFAVNLAMLDDRGGTPTLTPPECCEDYAGHPVARVRRQRRPGTCRPAAGRLRIDRQDQVPDAMATV